MDKKIPVPLRQLIGTNKEESLRLSVGKFSCRDKDIENFLKNKAFEFDIRHKSRTYIIVDDEADFDKEVIIYGFFTLTFKTLELNKTLSKSIIKRIDGFSKDVQTTEAILIGQLGKNENYQNDLNGQEILEYVFDNVYVVHNLAGGRIVFLECDESPKLVEFYSRNGFEPLQKSGGYLQMIKYL
ncbi:MAG: hypothetical protein FWF82_01285 [Oscillospiraceae bacterium]|nr:hypothetical protein [Oscillospiraceae bacterium]